MNSDVSSFDVVILGGGFAGVYCARALARKLGGDARKRVALVADQNFMVFQPLLAEVVGSSISPRHAVNPIRRLCPNVTVFRGAISSVDLPSKKVVLNAGNFAGRITLGFEHLVLGLGGIVDLSRVPGMPEHAFLLKNVGDALRLRAAIIDRFEEANAETDPKIVQRLLTFVVVGGGYSGVEVAGQINDLGDEILDLYPRLTRSQFRTALIHSGPHLLPEISASLGHYCEENLRSRGIEIVLNARVSAMTASKVCFGDRVIETHTVISTVGNAPHPLLVELCRANALQCEKGRVLTEPTMQVIGQPQVWAAGDCAAIPMPEKTPISPTTPRRFCPPTAQFAVRQGRVLGDNIVRVLTRDGEPKSFAFTGLGELAAIGHHAAVAEILGMKFSGFFAWWLWRTIYLAKLPGVERKLRVMIDWTLDLFFPRDITLFQTQPTQVVQEINLQTGDRIFEAGDPAFSFYIVKSGRIDLLKADGTLSRPVLPGEHFGERALLHDRLWQLTAVAAEQTVLVSLGADVFDTITRADKSIRDFLLATASKTPSASPLALPRA
jgi:NADH:ubiquinone reductase (H+-translocating)